MKNFVISFELKVHEVETEREVDQQVKEIGGRRRQGMWMFGSTQSFIRASEPDSATLNRFMTSAVQQALQGVELSPEDVMHLVAPAFDSPNYNMVLRVPLEVEAQRVKKITVVWYTQEAYSEYYPNEMTHREYISYFDSFDEIINFFEGKKRLTHQQLVDDEQGVISIHITPSRLYTNKQEREHTKHHTPFYSRSAPE